MDVGGSSPSSPTFISGMAGLGTQAGTGDPCREETHDENRFPGRPPVAVGIGCGIGG